MKPNPEDDPSVAKKAKPMNGHDFEHLNYRLTVIEGKIDHLHQLSHAIADVLAVIAGNLGTDNAKLAQAAEALRAKTAAVSAALAVTPIH